MIRWSVCASPQRNPRTRAQKIASVGELASYVRLYPVFLESCFSCTLSRFQKNLKSQLVLEYCTVISHGHAWFSESMLVLNFLVSWSHGRMLFTSCSSSCGCGDLCTNLPFQKLSGCKLKAVKVKYN